MSSVWHDWECNPQLTATAAIEKKIEIYLKKIRKKESRRQRFYPYILLHDFCKSILDISVLNSTFGIAMQYHVELRNMYYCIYLISVVCRS